MAGDRAMFVSLRDASLPAEGRDHAGVEIAEAEPLASMGEQVGDRSTGLGVALRRLAGRADLLPFRMRLPTSALTGLTNAPLVLLMGTERKQTASRGKTASVPAGVTSSRCQRTHPTRSGTISSARKPA